MTPFVKKAKDFATAAHKAIGQKRKYTGEDYIVHPAAVVEILKRHGLDDDVTLAAAWLHDVVEDCPVAVCEIGVFFGREVEQAVWFLTDPPAGLMAGNREQRKAECRNRLAQGDSRVHNIKVADMVDNTLTIVAHDPDFATVYMREKALLLPRLCDAKHALWIEAHRQVGDYYADRKAA